MSKNAPRENLKKELAFCLNLWEKNGCCEFGNYTQCEQCAAPYLLLKLINGELLHGNIKRLSLNDWKKQLEKL